MRLALSIFATIALFGCAGNQTGGGVVSPQLKPTSLSAARILLLPIADGVERKDGPAAGSGAAMTANLRDTLIQRGASPLVTEATGLSAAFEEARKLGYQYVLKGVFTEWEDNATEWSSRPDTAALSVELYDAATAGLIGTATHRERGSAVTLVSQSPERFIPLLSRAIIGKLFSQ
jgi:hypothetical protein